MKRYLIKTYGCQMNTSDSERLASKFEVMGYAATDQESEADVVVYNTCSVRQSAEDRVYGQLNKMRSIRKHNPNVKVLMTGCMATRPIVRKKTDSEVDYFLNIKEIHKLPELLGVSEKEIGDEYFDIKPKFSTNFTAYIPIMTGCNNYCSFCIVPYTRGKEISRSQKKVIEEVKQAIGQGYKEIFLLGQNVNSYEFNFPELLSKINKLEGDFWVRFVSSNPQDMSDELIEVLAQGTHLTPYIHFALQSGDNKVLKRMSRRYTREHYLNLVKKIREIVPGVFLATDIIVGFPGETEEQFQNTLKIMKEVEYDMAYINQYSPREGTPSARLYADDVSSAEKHKREFILNEELKKSALKHNEEEVGKTARVLVTGKARDGKWMGKDYAYRAVKFSDSNNSGLKGRFVEVTITFADAWGVEGEIIDG